MYRMKNILGLGAFLMVDIFLDFAEQFFFGASV